MTENPHAGQGMVVLDIGGDIGALVLLAPARLAGSEIEICPTGRRAARADEGGDWWQGEWRSHHHHGAAEPVAGPAEPSWPHVAVIGRPIAGGIEFSAVFPGLREGTYDVWVRPDGPTALTVGVTGAQVTTAGWPAQP
jgi:hypothetical protein